MRRFVLVVLVIVVAVASGYFVAHRSEPTADSYDGGGQVRVSRPRTDGNEVKLEDEKASIPPGSDPRAGALNALLTPPKGSSEEPPIPRGTKLRSVKVEGGIATVDFTAEFNGLKQHGSTMESLAQKSLRRTLAQFSEIDKMVILVEGKPFEGEHAEWNEPIPVRDENAGAPR
jgi:hypothetical protein